MSPFPLKLVTMPPLDECDTSFDKLNTPVVKDLYYEVILNKSNKPSYSASIPAGSLLVYTTLSNKCDVNHFPTLSELNYELRRNFVDHHPVLNNVF